MAANEFGSRRYRLISDRVFLGVVASYLALFVAIAATSGGRVPPEKNEMWKVNSAGTLVFGILERAETTENYAETGALTLSSHSTLSPVPKAIRSSPGNLIPSQVFDNKIANLPSFPPRTPGVGATALSDANEPGIGPVQIALANQSAFIGEDITPLPEPATWFAAALVAGAIAWLQRRRLSRRLTRQTQRGGWVSQFFPTPLFMLFFIGVAGASANSLRIGDEFDHAESLTEAAPLFSAWSKHLFQDMAMYQGIPSDTGFTQMPATSDTTINLDDRQSILIQGAPGETVTLNLKNFRMRENATLTLQGTTTTSFVINVTNQFSLTGNAKIVLSGGVQWNSVFFNVLGQGDPVRLSKQSSLSGILEASQRTVKLRGHATVLGEVIARKVLLSGASQITQPPVLSP